MKNLVKPVCVFALLFFLSNSLFSQVAIGDQAYGGIVFQIDKATGKGLVCSEKNLGTKYTWDDANLFCSNLDEGGFSDWRLPSEPELKLLYSNLQKTGKRNFGADFFWGQAQSAVNGWTMNFSQNGKPEPYTKTGHYKGKILPVRAFTLQEVKSKYVIEMLGRRGTLEFPALIQSKPATAKISMYGLTQSDVKAYNLTNIKWSENTLDADIRDATKPSQSSGVFSGLDASVNFIRLYFPGSSKYKVVGALTTPFIKDGIYSGNTSTLIVGYSPEAMSLFPQKPVQKHALVIRDQHAGVKDGKYDYRWYVDPKVAETNTFRELMILRDDLLKELALYEFANVNETGGRNEEDAKKNKILAYDLTEITKQIKVLFPKTDDYGIKTKLKGDLIALLITEGMKRYPSTVLGLKSTGHGTPVGIMNEFLEEDYLIERSLLWTTEVRKKPIDFLDLNTNCNAGSFYNFKSAAPYTNYILASDLTRYPTNSDDYQTFFNTTTSVQQTLVNILDNESKLQKTSCEGCKKFLMQASLFDAREFKKVADKLGPDAMKKVKDAVAKPENKNLIYLEETNKQVDFETAVPRIFPSYTTFASDWKKVLLKKIDNRDYVNTGIAKIPEAKGLLFIRVY